MNAHELMAAFETVAEAPEGVKRLRELVLGLAVRGRLVGQDERDERAAALVARAPFEKQRLIAVGLARSETALADPSAKSVGFDLPAGWVAAALGNVATVLDHRREPVKADEREARCVGKREDVLFPYFGATQQQGWIDDYRLDGEFVLLGEDGVPFLDPSKPKAYAVMGKVWVNNHAHVLLGVAVVNRYLLHYLNAFDYAGRVTGTTRAKLTKGDMVDIPVAVPPLAEQHRIVARVDELMGLLDRLEAARTTRDALRRSARDAALAALRDAEDPEAVEAAWARIAGRMDTLFAEPEDVGPLRQAVLQLAVRGRLVPQDPKDEAADNFVRRIASEKAGSHGAGSPLWANVPTDAQPFAVPTGWSWARLVDLLLAITDGDHLPPPQVPEGVPFLTIGNVSKGALDFQETRHVPETYFKKLGQMRVPEPGDLLYTVVGATYGRPVRVDTSQPFCVQRHIAILKSAKAGFRDYLFWFLRSGLAYDQATASVTGSAQPTVALRPLRNFVVPVPPLPEQHRIVVKVDALMALCDTLEARLTTTRDVHAQLAAAAVHHLDV